MTREEWLTTERVGDWGEEMTRGRVGFSLEFGYQAQVGQAVNEELDGQGYQQQAHDADQDADSAFLP